jgi:hypothetical protein
MANGLINLQTDLKSLRYGSDKPYITSNIGQAPGSQIGLEVERRLDDTSRIAQMLIDKPGIKYLLHEAELQQIGVAQRIKKAQQGGKSLAGAVLGQLGNTLVTTVKIIGSTLAQVPVNGTGTHFLKGFRTDTYLQPSGGNTASGFAQFFGAGGIEGAQYALRGETVPGTVAESNFYTGSSTITSALESLDLSKTTNTYTPGNTFNTVITPEGQASRVSTKDTVEGSTTNEVSGAIAPTDVTDKFSNVNSATNKYYAEKSDVTSKNGNITKEARIRLGDQGSKGTPNMQLARKTNSYWFKSENALEVDKLNALFPNDGKVDGETEGRDLIKFRFHILTADGKEKVLYFRAFLDSFADNYSGQWNPVKYLGRAEDFQIYGGFQRKISLSFKIAAASRSEMRPIYEKMIWLASATAPTYANDGQFMRGTITKITVGDYIYELPGVLNSVNYTWNTEYPWEIAMTEPENLGKDDFEQELPMVMDCSIDFTPIHTFTPTTGLKQYITTKTSEAGRNGIPNIANEKIGTVSTPAIAPTALAAPPTLLASPTFGTQLA